MIIHDLSRSIEHGMPKIPVLPEVKVDRIISLEKGHPLNVQKVEISTHIGTHVDAPLHIVPNGKAIEDLPLDRFCGTGVVIDVRKSEAAAITADDLIRSGVEVRRDDILMLYTGWEDKFGTDAYDLHPYLSEDCAQWMVDQGVKMMGLDCITVDLPTPLRPKPFGFPIHKILLGNEVLIAENVVNLRPLCGKRLLFQAFPIKVARGDAGQARIIAIEEE